jgi:fatty acid desaturase
MTDPSFRTQVREHFRLQEGKLLLRGQDKVDRPKQFYDQITVLRGAAFNGFILALVCVFGFCGYKMARWSGRRKRFLTLSPAIGVIAWGVLALILSHIRHPSSAIDPPFAEIVLILLGIVGFGVIVKASQAHSATFYVATGLVAAILAVVSYLGWWWTEILYDLLVIHSAGATVVP